MKTASESIGLASLLYPLSEAEFFKTYWPHRPLFLPKIAGKLAELFTLTQLDDLEALLASRREKVRACLPDYEDEFSSVLLEPDDAPKAYRNQMTLVFDGMQKQSAVIAALLKRLRHDLGMASGSEDNDLTRARSIAYATPAGGRTRMHFDANANFVLQLKGTKRWQLAPNTSVEDPTERYTTGTGELAAALETQCHAQLPEHMPDSAQEILMEPGCVLFVPRGYWHETSTEEDSLSLNFTFSQPTWADVLTRSLYEVLLQATPWRGLADGLESADPKRRANAVAHFASLFQSLATDLPTLGAEELLGQAGWQGEIP